MVAPVPTLSVVVTTFRRDDFLFKAVESLAHQTLPVHEIVVVDDGGSGSAKRMLSAFGERVTYVWQPNAGMQAARNTGIAVSTGDWVGFLDDDDFWDPERHAVAQPLLVSGEVDVISGDFRKFGEGWVAEHGEFRRWPECFWPMPLRRDNQVQFIGWFPPDGIFPTHPFWPSTLVVRRSLIDAIGGWDVRVRGIVGEDYHFVYRALRAGKLGLVTLPTVRYRVHSGNAGKEHRVALGRLQLFDTIVSTVATSARERAALLPKEGELLLSAHWAARALGRRHLESEISRRALRCASLTAIQRLRLQLGTTARHLFSRALTN